VPRPLDRRRRRAASALYPAADPWGEVATRVVAALERRGLISSADEGWSEPDSHAHDEPAVAACYGATIQGGLAFGEHAGERVPRLGAVPDAPFQERGEAQISDRDFARLPFEAGRQQLVVAQGCQTYSQYADMLYANPNRGVDTLDVITTVNYSYGLGTLGLFDRLVRLDRAGVHQPSSYNELVTGLNAEYWNRQKLVFYGVIGIETNPALHPWANVAGIGAPCAWTADCGANPDASVCVPVTGGESRCAVRAVAERACPEGSYYAYIASGRTLVGGVCSSL
jgi:hypothetical protein